MTKQKGRTPREARPQKDHSNFNLTKDNPIVGWHALAAAARKFQRKRWRKGGRR